MSDHDTSQILAALAELNAQHAAMGREIGELKSDVKELESRQRASDEAMSRLTGKLAGYGTAGFTFLALLEMAILIWK